ncbi:MAG: beta-ketoacyl synthase N-terminal-like domain-containing protein [Bacteriovoracaceae bacterium]
MTTLDPTSVCIVGIGAVLPNANNKEEFWNNILNEQSAIKEISDVRWDKSLSYHPNVNEPDKSYSKIAAEVSKDVIKLLKKKHNIAEDTLSDLHVLAIEAMTQASVGIKSKITNDQKALILGFMNPDKPFMDLNTSLSDDRTREEIKKNNPQREEELNKILFELSYEVIKDETARRKNIKKNEIIKRKSKESAFAINELIRTEILAELKKRFFINGESFYCDAACASTLAAIELSVQKLVAREADLVFTGGIEDNLTCGAFVIFSKVKALATNHSLPFDKKSEGLVQGEGAVVFALQRLEDALRDNNPIYGVIAGVGNSSDGKTASLFQPTVEGQLLAYQRAYKDLENNRVDYIEGHGTGTPIGDIVELHSLATFFKDLKIPIGSVKALIGHTKGAAGGAGLLKCLLAMDNHTIPASSYVHDKALATTSDLFINAKPVKIENRTTPLRMGISSLGFGGINYHLVVDEYKPQFTNYRKFTSGKCKVVLTAEHFLDQKECMSEKFLLDLKKFRIPPKVIDQIDKTQLMGLVCTKLMLDKINFNSKKINKNDVSVISTSTTGLNRLIDMSGRLLYDVSYTYLSRKNSHSSDISYLFELFKKLKYSIPAIKEDSGHGILNNVIAGRICNGFDFKGRNFNIDSDLTSLPCAVNLIKRYLAMDPKQLFILVSNQEKVNKEQFKVESLGMRGLVLTSMDFALEHELPIISELTEVIYE